MSRCRIVVALVLLLGLVMGCSVFGAYDNPHDPLGTNYVPPVSTPGAVYLVASRDAATLSSFLAFQLPTDAKLASVEVTYQDVTPLPAGSITTVSLGLAAAPLGSYAPDPLLSFPSVNNRYFEPPVVAGDSYQYTVTMVDSDGKRSQTQTAGNTDPGSVTVIFAPTSYQTLSFANPNPTVAAGANLVLAPDPGTLATSGTGWDWYRAGTTVSTASNYTFNSAVPGFFVVNVTVHYQGVLYSGSVNVTVTQ